MKTLWALRHAIGTLLAFGLVAALVAWAFVHYPVYGGVGVVILIALIAARRPRVRRERERKMKLVDVAFQDAYASLSSPPSIVISSSYGYPAFQVRFRSKLEMQAAATRNDAFKAEIDKIFKNSGPRSRPFSVDMAIFFFYDGYLDELRARYKSA